MSEPPERTCECGDSGKEWCDTCSRCIDCCATDADEDCGWVEGDV